MTNITKRLEDIDVWKKLDQVKKVSCPDLSPDEFTVYVGLGKSLGANPFTREIWAVKYGSKPAQIFLARDFYRKKAQEQKNYNGHLVDSVYENDTYSFDAKEGIPTHKYKLKDRGQMIGAYGLAWRKGVDRPFYIFIKASEYNKDQSTWKQMPDTMLKKVAEAQILRMGWQGLFQGTYTEDEQRVIESGNKKIQAEGFGEEPPMIQEIKSLPATAEEPPEDYPEVQDE